MENKANTFFFIFFYFFYCMCSVAVISESGRTFALMLSSFEAKDIAIFYKLPEISVNLSMNTPTQ